MMHQPLIGWDFTTYLPAALVPYILLLVFNVFNRVASLFTRSDSMEFEDDFETQSGAAARGMQLLQVELENFNAGRPLGLTISTQGVQSRHSTVQAWLCLQSSERAATSKAALHTIETFVLYTLDAKNGCQRSELHAHGAGNVLPGAARVG